MKISLSVVTNLLKAAVLVLEEVEAKTALPAESQPEPGDSTPAAPTPK